VPKVNYVVVRDCIVYFRNEHLTHFMEGGTTLLSYQNGFILGGTGLNPCYYILSFYCQYYVLKPKKETGMGVNFGLFLSQKMYMKV
jgi:hypothetical protein